LQRAYDQVIEDVALQRLGVFFAVDRSGIVGEDGFSHQGIFDLTFLSGIPNLVVMAPRDGREFEMMIDFALTTDKPLALRYPRAAVPISNISVPKIEFGKAEVLREAKDLYIIAIGSMVLAALGATEILAKEGIQVGVINSRFAKPLDNELLSSLALKARYIFTVEEGVLAGGFGSTVSAAVNRPVVRIGLPLEFITHGKRELLLDKYGLTPQGIAQRVRDTVKAKS